jgi:hypothetical protein
VALISQTITQEAFEAADLDGDQAIDADELLLVEERLGQHPGPSGLVR